jgi:hypothetical protein
MIVFAAVYANQLQFVRYCVLLVMCIRDVVTKAADVHRALLVSQEHFKDAQTLSDNIDELQSHNPSADAG